MAGPSESGVGDGSCPSVDQEPRNPRTQALGVVDCRALQNGRTEERITDTDRVAVMSTYQQILYVQIETGRCRCCEPTMQMQFQEDGKWTATAPQRHMQFQATLDPPCSITAGHAYRRDPVESGETADRVGTVPVDQSLKRSAKVIQHLDGGRLRF